MTFHSMASKDTPLARFLVGLSIIVTLVILIVAMARVWPIGADYWFTFRPVAEKFVHGETRLYDSESVGFFKAPWTLLFLVPLTWFSLNTGQAILTVGSIVMLLGSTHLLKRKDKIYPAYAYVFALLNLHTFDLLIRGQVDVLILFGIALGWWSIRNHRPVELSIGFWLMAIKPLNVVLPALVYLIAIRHWPVRDQVKALSIPVVSLVASFAVIGLDWPLRYLDNYKVYSPPKEYLTLTLWRVAHSIELPYWPIMILAAVFVVLSLRLAWRRGLTELTLSIALATNLVFAQYATGNHYVYLIPAVLFIATRDRRLALVAYLATFTPLLRLGFGTSVAPVDLVYPAILLASTWYLLHQERSVSPLPEPAVTPA